jgi:hypothetical protein
VNDPVEMSEEEYAARQERIKDELREKLKFREDHPFYHLCRRCIGLTKVVAVAMLVEVITFYPTHELFKWIGVL